MKLKNSSISGEHSTFKTVTVSAEALKELLIAVRKD